MIQFQKRILGYARIHRQHLISVMSLDGTLTDKPNRECVLALHYLVSTYVVCTVTSKMLPGYPHDQQGIHFYNEKSQEVIITIARIRNYSNSTKDHITKQPRKLYGMQKQQGYRGYSFRKV